MNPKNEWQPGKEEDRAFSVFLVVPLDSNADVGFADSNREAVFASRELAAFLLREKIVEAIQRKCLEGEVGSVGDANIVGIIAVSCTERVARLLANLDQVSAVIKDIEGTSKLAARR